MYDLRFDNMAINLEIYDLRSENLAINLEVLDLLYERLLIQLFFCFLFFCHPFIYFSRCIDHLRAEVCSERAGIQCHKIRWEQLEN